MKVKHTGYRSLDNIKICATIKIICKQRHGWHNKAYYCTFDVFGCVIMKPDSNITNDGKNDEQTE